jgi:hypothetical protein
MRLQDKRQRRISAAFLPKICLPMGRSRRQPTGTAVVNKVFPLFALCLAALCLSLAPTRSALAQDRASQNSMFLPSGKSTAMQALEAKRNARCAALYGPGYGALGDSETCIKIGGSVGVSVGVGSTKHNRLILPSPGIGAPAPVLGGPVVGVTRSKPSVGTAASASFYVDTHTPTELGDFGTHLSVRGIKASGSLRTMPDYVR